MLCRVLVMHSPRKVLLTKVREKSYQLYSGKTGERIGLSRYSDILTATERAQP